MQRRSYVVLFSRGERETRFSKSVIIFLSTGCQSLLEISPESPQNRIRKSVPVAVSRCLCARVFAGVRSVVLHAVRKWRVALSHDAAHYSLLLATTLGIL